MALAMAGCSGAEEPCVPSAKPLVQVDAWRIADDSSDPFSDRPQATDCRAEFLGVEGRAVEVSTDDCAYVTLTQPTTAPVQACETLRATVAHFPLIAAEPSEAHVAFHAGDTPIFDEVIPIPSDSGVHVVELPGPLDAGTPLYFHLHNHGSNDYYLADVRTE